jgi:glycosyltransferase involved in cell wall biosynthesis
VQPRHGAFPELIDSTGGGLLVDPGSPRALAEALLALREDPGRRAELGRAGREAVHRDHGDAAMAGRTLAVYRRALGGDEDSG